ncbi:DUF2071 domain-containing protein [Hymenobacter sp. BT664]|uniref:DUF2071 domain-containing protein n=1 Tax=Hymenobacter montanus TaxID=2771359 RepID=A0A927BC71_9BACT|nr:DUF2071 domain-containing protein [Hymenobacter montanus]MBD2768097.1 DUF2071 domain-containing protein [Hymenobacter montanus]
MKLPVLHGYIDRRMLVNFTADPAVVRPLLPAPFQPQLYQGKAVVGICLIRLRQIKPKGLPGWLGVNSENGAHRIAVEWEEAGQLRQGVYIPRRDTSFCLNALAGGRLFPGKHHLAAFDVREASGSYHVSFTSADGTSLSVDAQETAHFAPDSIFSSLAAASAFFEQGAVGYSPGTYGYEGIRLHARQWQVRPLDVLRVQSSFFEDAHNFPPGSIRFDNALLMTNIEHEWHGQPTKRRRANECCG